MATLRVSNLSNQVCNNDLSDLFCNYGRILEIKPLFDFPYRSALYGDFLNTYSALITYQDHRDAEDARRNLDGTTYKGFRMSIRVNNENGMDVDGSAHLSINEDKQNNHRRDTSDFSSQTQIYDNTLRVANLSEHRSEQNLQEIFGKYGRLQCVVKQQADYLVSYQDSRDAEDALRELQGCLINNQRIKIAWHHSNSFQYDKSNYLQSNQPQYQQPQYQSEPTNRKRLLVDMTMPDKRRRLF
ncbi:Hypothetical protein HVR_LOCUS911 [uncultured virus]|nr:Hypothetical protein HVR_LOCUS911 [uncultured virus]